MKPMLMLAVPLLALATIVGFQRPRSNQELLSVGDVAPTFRLKYLGKNEFFDLKENVGKRPTVLIFGSYT